MRLLCYLCHEALFQSVPFLRELAPPCTCCERRSPRGEIPVNPAVDKFPHASSEEKAHSTCALSGPPCRSLNPLSAENYLSEVKLAPSGVTLNEKPGIVSGLLRSIDIGFR